MLKTNINSDLLQVTSLLLRVSECFALFTFEEQHADLSFEMAAEIPVIFYDIHTFTSVS